MLPSTGRFTEINCPFLCSGLCERPYCHFRHAKKEPLEFQQMLTVNSGQPSASSIPLGGSGELIQRLVSEAVRKVLEQTDFPLSQPNISCAIDNIARNVVTKDTEIFVPPSSSGTPFVSTFKASTSQQNIPSYKPTPISLLKNKQNRHIPISYSASLCKNSTVLRKRTNVEYVTSMQKKSKPTVEVNRFPSLHSTTLPTPNTTKAYTTESQLLDELSEPPATNALTSQNSTTSNKNSKYIDHNDRHSFNCSIEEHNTSVSSSRNHTKDSASINELCDPPEYSLESTSGQLVANGSFVGSGSTEFNTVCSTSCNRSNKDYVSKSISRSEKNENEDLDLTKQIEILHKCARADVNSNHDGEHEISSAEDEMVVSSSDDVLNSVNNCEEVSQTDPTRKDPEKYKTKSNKRLQDERKQKNEKRKNDDKERTKSARKSDKRDGERDNKHSESSGRITSNNSTKSSKNESDGSSVNNDRKMKNDESKYKNGYEYAKREECRKRKSDGEKKSDLFLEHNHKKDEVDIKCKRKDRKSEDTKEKCRQNNSSEYSRSQVQHKPESISGQKYSYKRNIPQNSLKPTSEKKSGENNKLGNESKTIFNINDANESKDTQPKSVVQGRKEKSQRSKLDKIEELKKIRTESKNSKYFGYLIESPGTNNKIIHDDSGSDSEISDNDSLKNVTLPRDTCTSSDEETVTEECYRIFREYEPSNASRKSVPVAEHREEINDEPVAKKQRVAHKAAENSKSLRPVVKRNFGPTPSQVLTERLKKLRELSQTMNPAITKNYQQCLSSTRNPPSSVARPSPGCDSVSQMGAKKRIAHVPNVPVILNAKMKIQQQFTEQSFRREQISSLIGNYTKAQTISKGSQRVAHIPSDHVLKRPIITEVGGKISANVRQTYLNILVDEYLKVCSTEEEAFKRAEEEEKSIYSRSTIRSVYSSHISNSINRLRKANQRNSTNSSRKEDANVNGTISHSSMLVNRGAKGSWSIEKPWKPPSVTSKSLYEQMSRFVITEDQLKENGFPMSDSHEKNVAVIHNFRKTKFVPATSLQRMCARCSKIYYVNQLGKSVKEENCIYHWGRLFQTKTRGVWEARYNCCHGDGEAIGCSVGTCHVSDTSDSTSLRGFVKTLPKESAPPDGDYGVYALDCEMCYTTAGLELTRVTVVGRDLGTVYETFVRPESEILDYNTRFSGIRKADLEHVTTNIYEVQSALLSFINDKTILIGHSLESDFKALKLIHYTVVDTSIVYPHKMGLPKKKSLKTLCGDLLQKIIQENEGGHDSAEDAKAAMEIMLFKVKEDMKT